MASKKAVQTGLWLAVVVGLAGCAGTAGDAEPVDSDLVTGAADESGTLSNALSSTLPIGSTLKTTSGLNLRTGAGTTFNIRLVIPQGGTVVTVNQAAPKSGWYNVKYNGIEGWSSGNYLTLVSSPNPTPTPTPTPTPGPGEDLSSPTRGGAILRAQSGVGFSYFWGHGSWSPASSSHGSCTGSCPSCSHSGQYGADCSGYVGKIWQVPSGNTNLSSDSHPYSTVSFNGASSQWRTVSRAAVVKGDALVHNSGGAGHIFLYESGDGWGSMWAYEAKGCSYGIIHDLRTASTAYKAIAHY